MPASLPSFLSLMMVGMQQDPYSICLPLAQQVGGLLAFTTTGETGGHGKARRNHITHHSAIETQMTS